MDNISKLLIYIPGIIIFLVGSRQAGEWIRRIVFGSLISAKVISCNHVRKTDHQDREVFDYYDTLLEYKNPENQRIQRFQVKSLYELVKGQKVRITLDRKGENPVVASHTQEYNLHPVAMALVGVCLILMAMEINASREVTAALYFGIALLLAGCSMVVYHISLKRKHLLAVDGKIIDVYKRQISKESKILKGSKFTNYPIVQFQIDGQDTNFRPEVNASGDKEFQINDNFRLYYDTQSNDIYEKPFSVVYLIIGAVLSALGVLILASAVSVML